MTIHDQHKKRPQRQPQIRSFQAASMDLALQQIHAVLGDDAQIIDSKKVVRKGRYPWSREEAQVIVKARPASRKMRPVRKPGSAPVVATRNREPHVNRINRPPLSVTMKQELDTAMEQPNHDCSETATPVAANLDSTPEESNATAPPTGDPAAIQQSLNFTLHEPTDADDEISESVVPPEVKVDEQKILDRFETFKKQLTDAEVDDKLVTEILTALIKQADQTQLEDDTASCELLNAIIDSRINVAEPITLQNDTRQVIAFVGTPGVGKTTTMVKLAAQFAIEGSSQIAFISFDNYRVAATEQLRAFAEIMNISIHVASNLLELRRAVEATANCDFVFLDTAGRTSSDDLAMQELKQLLAEADADRVILCVGADASRTSLTRTAARFSSVGATQVIATKTDEATPGAVLTLLDATQLPIVYTSHGQNVPADIEPANGTQIARSVMTHITLENSDS